jgi:hypothetical protein
MPIPLLAQATLSQATLAQATLDGYFFGSGKAAVVAAVVMVILVGIGWALRGMDKRLTELEKEQLEK